MSLLQQPQIKWIGPTTLGNPFSQFVAPTAPDPVVPNITPRKPPVDLSQGATMAPMPVAKPTLPQGIPEPKLQPTYAHVPWDNKDQFWQSQTPGEFDPNNLIKDIWSTGKWIKNTMNEVGDFFQNKAPWLETAKQNNKFLTQDHLTNKITTAIQSMPDATDEEIAQAIGQLKNEGYIFEGMNDKNFNNPVTNFLGKTPLGEWADLMWWFAKMWGNFVGGTLEWGAQISEGVADIMGWDTNKWASKVVAWWTNYWLNLLGGMFPWVSSVFNTEAVKPVVENTLGVLNEWIKDNIVNKWLDLTGMDPNSEEYKNYSEAWSNVLTLLTTLGLAKTGQVAFRETFWTDLNYNNATVKDFVKSTGKTADDLADAIKAKNPEFNTNISDSTPISKIFTPEEYAYIEALARQNGSSGVWRREWLISDATQAKIKEKITNGFKMAEKRAKEPTPISDENAINSQGIKWTVPEPTVLTNIKDKVFGDSKDIDLANRAVSPRNVKGKTMTDKMQGGKVALAGIQQLHDDSIAGNITADIGTLEGGIAGIEEARQYHGKIIGENANQDQKVAVSDIGQTLKEDLQNPIMVISGPIKGIGDDLVQMLDHPSYQDWVNMKDVQTTLSTISNRIRNSPELRNSLQSEPAGQAVSAFIDELSARYEKAIEEGGNWPADREARIAYAKIKKIQDDLLNSWMVNARNTRTGQSGFVGKSIATYELLTHGVSGIPVALAMKYLGETKWEYATRGGAYAKLIRNMDRKALQRTKWVYNTGDSSKYTPPAPKTAKPTPKPKKDAWTTVNSNSVSADTVDMAWTEWKPTPRSNIPGSTRTKIEVPGNPKGNISNKLAWNKWVIVPKDPNMIEDTSKILPSGDRMHKEEVKQIERDLNSALKSNNMANKPQWAREFIDRAMNDGKITKEDAIAMVEKLYEKADWFQKPWYEKLLNDLFANKKTVSFDDLLNEKQDNKPTISPRQEYLESPKGMYEKFRKMSADGRYNHNTTDAFMEKFKEKTGFDLMNDGDPVFDKDWQIVKGKTEKYRTNNVKPMSTENNYSAIKNEMEKNPWTEIVFHNTNSTAKDSWKGIFTMEKVSKNVLGWSQVEAILVKPNKKFQSANQYTAYKELFWKEIREGTFDLDKYDTEIYNELKKRGYDMIEYKEPLVWRSTEKVILDEKIIKNKKNIWSRNDALDITNSEKYRTADDMNNTQLTTKILKWLGDRETVSKEFIRNMTNSGDVKQIEKDIIRGLLESEGDKINVADFKKKVQAELLPLKRKNSKSENARQVQLRNDLDNLETEILRFNDKHRDKNHTQDEMEVIQKEYAELHQRKEDLRKSLRGKVPENRYEYVSLKWEEKWRVKNYQENIYESPIETEAGWVHFSWQTDNYFWHTRIEDMENGTRRVIEVQSDLFQKGRLEKEMTDPDRYKWRWALTDDEWRRYEILTKKDSDNSLIYWDRPLTDTESNELAKLKGKIDKWTNESERLHKESKKQLNQYNDPTAHFRMIREEVSQAVKDGVKELQFPTGETAMKIEGLGESAEWFSDVEKPNGFLERLTPESVKKWMTITDQNWEPHIVLRNFWDGTFRVIMKDLLDQFIKDQRYEWISLSEKEAIDKFQEIWFTWEFVDLNLWKEKYSSNPIYKFYEKEVGRYLKNKYDAKLVTDDKWVSWYQVDVKDSMGWPVEAFRKTDITPKVTPKMTPEQKIELQELNKKFFGDDSIQIVDKIDSNAEALGSYKGGMIKIVEGQGKPLDTLHHEAVHKYLDVFATEKEAKAILEYWKEKYKDSDYASVEEKIAEDFIKYAKDRSGFVWSIRKLFDSIIDRIKQFFGNGDKIQKMYRDIMAGKAKKVDLGIKPKDEKFREDDQAWKTSNTHPDNPIKYKIEETKWEKSIVIDVWPKENIKGKWITKSVLLDLLKDSYSKWVTTIQPSYGMWTTQWWGFMENLQNAWFIKAWKKIGWIETFDIMDSIKNRETENKLGRTDITPKIKPRK